MTTQEGKRRLLEYQHKVREKCAKKGFYEPHDALEDMREFGIIPVTRALSQWKSSQVSGEILSKKLSSYLMTTCHRCLGTNTLKVDTNFNIMYEGMEREIVNWLKTYVDPNFSGKRDSYLLEQFSESWEQHKVFTRWMHMMFFSLTAFHRAHEQLGRKKITTTTSRSLQLFKELIFEKHKGNIFSTVLAYIERDREGEVTDYQVLKSTLQLSMCMGVCGKEYNFKNLDDMMQTLSQQNAAENEIYQQEFEALLLEQSQEYFNRKSREWLDQMDTAQYLRKVNDVITAERDRVMRYMHSSTEPKLEAACLTPLITAHSSNLLTSPTGFSKMMADKNVRARQHSLHTVCA